MNVRITRFVAEWWEWPTAGSLSVASCAALVLLLALLVRTPAPAALRTACVAVGASCAGADGVGAQESGRSKWLAIGTHASPCPFCQVERPQAEAVGRGVWSDLRYDTLVMTAADRTGGSQRNSARTTVITVSVMLVWLLGLRVIVGPLRPLHHSHHRSRWSRSF